MLDHRILFISLLALVLALSAAPSSLQQPAGPAASRLVPIEVEPDVVAPGADEAW